MHILVGDLLDSLVLERDGRIYLEHESSSCMAYLLVFSKNGLLELEDVFEPSHVPLNVSPLV